MPATATFPRARARPRQAPIPIEELDLGRWMNEVLNRVSSPERN